MEYLGENLSDNTCIYRLTRAESEAIRHLLYALTRTRRDHHFVVEADYQAMVSKAVAAMNQLSELLEAGPIKLTFAPVEVQLL